MTTNVDKPIQRILHMSLERASDESPFRSWCPVCDKGLLLVKQVFIDKDGRWSNLPDSSTVDIKRSRLDRCTSCGQQFWYWDDEIEGIDFYEPADLVVEPGDVPQMPRSWHDRLDDF